MSKEALVSTITRPEVISLEQELRSEIGKLHKKIQDGVRVNVNAGDKIRGDKVGHDKNSDSALKIIAGALVAVAFIVAWLFYYVATTTSRIPPSPPPSIPSSNP
jgi:hypothetical protein